MKDETLFSFRFDSAEQKLEFKIQAAKENKSMNQLLGERVRGYLRDKREVGTV